MKKSVLVLCVIVFALSVVFSFALAMDYDEIMEAVKSSEGTYEIGGPLTKDDFMVYSTDDELAEYDYDLLLYLDEYDWHASYPNTAENSAILGSEGVDIVDMSYTYTLRGISVDDRGEGGHDVDPSLYSKETVLLRYGIGVEGVFDSQKDEVYQYYKKDFGIIMGKSDTWLLYNYQDRAQLKFYFDSENHISWVVYFYGIQETADKETTKTIQQYLNENGYECGTPDGVAGNKTKAALMKFQEDHGLFPSGYIDDSLMKYLDGQNG